MEKIYYLDNAATTKVFDEEFDLIKDLNNDFFYNPSASYKQSINVSKKYNLARNSITKLLKGDSGKFYFVSSATEANNTIFEGLHLRPGDEILISKAEHPSVYNAAHRLEKKGIIIKDIPLTSAGVVDFEEYKKLLSSKVVLVSIIHVSNETGAINDIKTLSEYAKNFNSNIKFHSDGVQAFGKIKVNLKELGVDLYTISAHKVYSFRGIAGLWVNRGVVIDPLLVGGGQEENFRSSTENVYGAIAFAYAAEKISKDIDKNYEIVKNYRKQLIQKLMASKISSMIKVNSLENSSPYILSLSFSGIKGEVLMYSLESDNVLISTGSACSAKKAGNRTLEAMGLDSEFVIGSVRISFSPYMEYDLDYVAASIEKNVLRFKKN